MVGIVLFLLKKKQKNGGEESYSTPPLQVPLETSRGVAACLNKAIYVVDENQQNANSFYKDSPFKIQHATEVITYIYLILLEIGIVCS